MKKIQNLKIRQFLPRIYLSSDYSHCDLVQFRKTRLLVLD